MVGAQLCHKWNNPYFQNLNEIQLYVSLHLDLPLLCINILLLLGQELKSLKQNPFINLQFCGSKVWTESTGFSIQDLTMPESRGTLGSYEDLGIIYFPPSLCQLDRIHLLASKMPISLLSDGQETLSAPRGHRLTSHGLL